MEEVCKAQQGPKHASQSLPRVACVCQSLPRVACVCDASMAGGAADNMPELAASSPHFHHARSPAEALSQLQHDDDDSLEGGTALEFDSPAAPQHSASSQQQVGVVGALEWDASPAPPAGGAASSASVTRPLVWNGTIWTSADGSCSQFPDAELAAWDDDASSPMHLESHALQHCVLQQSTMADGADGQRNTAHAFADRVAALRARALARAEAAGLPSSSKGSVHTPTLAGGSSLPKRGSSSCAGSSLPSAKRGKSVTARAIRATRLLAVNVVSSALRGFNENVNGHSLSQCNFPTYRSDGIKVPCWHHAWRLIASVGEASGEEGKWAEQFAKLSSQASMASAFTSADLHFVAKRAWFMQSLAQEERGRWVFQLLQHGWHADVDAATRQISGAERMHYYVHGQEVCRHTFLLAYPVDSSTLGRIVSHIKGGAKCAYEKEELGVRERPPNDSEVELDVAAWLYNWAEDNGEELPGKEHWGRLYVPRTDVTDLHREMVEEFKEVGLYPPDTPSYRMVLRVWNEHPTLKHVRRARDKRNFQGCSQCTTLRVAIRRAARSGCRAELLAARAELAAHKKLQKDQRQLYYKRRWMARQKDAGCLSIIFDKWNSQTTTVPYFMRAPVDVWKKLKKMVLGMHVLLVMVHGRPNSNYFYYMNGAIRGDANFNIEGIRRSMLAHADGGALPETLYGQMDRAGDNLNFTMLGFFGVLVLWGMLGQVFISCLVVSHTHEDVDQTFSVGARFMYKAMGMLLSVAEFFGAMMEAYRGLSATHTKVQSVLDWKWWLGTGPGKDCEERCCINKKGMKGLRTQRIDGIHTYTLPHSHTPTLPHSHAPTLPHSHTPTLR
jgi:hypothetical protein